MTTPRVAKRARPRGKARGNVDQLVAAEPASDNGTAKTPASKSGSPAARTSLRERAAENVRLLAALALLAAGIVFVLLGWYGAANTNILSEQIPYLISGGLLGLGLIVVAGNHAASAATIRETQALRRDIAALAVGARPAGARHAERVSVVPGGSAYHVAGCPVAEGKSDATSMTEREAIEAGYATCRLCGPE